MDVAAQVEDLIREVLAGDGVELVHVEYQPRGAASVLRIYIDKPGGVNLSDCERVSRHVGVLLDVEDLIPHQYVLEVSSPGIERPLFREEDYQRFSDKEVRLETVEKIEGRKNFVGFIRDFQEGILTLDCEGAMYRIPFGQIRKANLVFR